MQKTKMKLTNDTVIIDKLDSDILYAKEEVKIFLEGLSDILYELIITIGDFDYKYKHGILYKINNNKSKDTSTSKLERIISYRDSFKDLKNHEIKKNKNFTENIHRPNTLINYQPPYSLQEVEDFEKRNNIELPEELKIYLTQVSKSIYKNHLEFKIIELKDNENFNKPCILEDTYTSCPDESDEEEYEKNPILNLHGMMEIRTIGCGYTDQIILNGKFKGTIWTEYFAADGEITKTFDSFFDYILEI